MFYKISTVSNTGRWVVMALWLSACQAHSFSARLGGSSGTSSAGSTSAASSGGDTGAPASSGASTPGETNNSPLNAATDPEPSAADIARDRGHRWTRLIGYTPEEAIRRAKAAGFTGKIEVSELSAFDPKCKSGTVCTFYPTRWELDQDDTLTLSVNHKVTIATPD